MIIIPGNCPMGCGATLRLNRYQIECSNRNCADRDAVAKLLADSESEHVISVTEEDGFTVKHPLRERIDDGLFACRLLDEFLETYEGRPITMGHHRVTRDGSGWKLEKLAGASS